MNNVARIIRTLVIHCAYTPPSMDIGAKEIHQWHTWPRKLGRYAEDGYMFEGRHYEHVDDLPEDVRNQEGNGWTSIGYHYVIRRNGDIENGRAPHVPGAHVAGHNAHSLGICMVGGKAEHGGDECNFTVQQWRALEKLVKRLMKLYGDKLAVKGHNDLNPNKACPTFNAFHWWSNYGK